MSEEKEGPESGSEAIGAGAAAAAIALALGGASREKADIFLDKQSSLIDAQKHHLHEQFKHLHLSVWEKQLGVLLRVATVIVGMAFATAIAVMVWDAAHSAGLLIEPFSVPPDLAARGLTGQAVASQMLDKLTTMQTVTQTFRPPRSYANNWGADIKVEIPETGVSIGEFRRFLREWLGHDTHISGEVWHTDSGISISARAGGDSATAFAGPQSDFDALVQKAAERVFAQTQPYRYANYIRGERRFDEAVAIYQQLTESSSPVERGWAWQGIGNLAESSTAVGRESTQAAVWALRKAVEIYPDYTLGHASLSAAERRLGHTEAGFAQSQIVQRLINRASIPDIDPAFLETAKHIFRISYTTSLGDYAQTVSILRSGIQLPDATQQREIMRANLATSLALQHDARGARAYLRQMPPVSSGLLVNRRALLPFSIAAASQDWEQVLALETVTEKVMTGIHMDRPAYLYAFIYPAFALAKAKAGDITGAEAVIAATPGDCYDCVRTRGLIAAQAKQWGRADYWFVKAIHDAPSIPFAYTDWGQALVARGKPDEAIAQFKLSNQKGPHFADALEGWGEALMAKNQSHKALAKFAEAEKYAPNWGRLHLKWGEALAYSGKKDEAAKHFARAATLNLTPSEKSELARMSPRMNHV